MTIYVKTPDGKKVAIKDVKPSDPVSKFKQKVEKKTEIPAKKQVLQDKKGKTLKDDSKPIKKYGVKDKDTLKILAVKSKKRMRVGVIPMTIYVKTPDGKKVAIKDVKPS